MDSQWILCLSAILLSVAQASLQIQSSIVTPGCVITSISSPSASSLQIAWDTTADATNYLLDLRIVNSTSTAPVVVFTSWPNRKVQGLKCGQLYEVTLKAFRSHTSLLCQSTQTSWTVPATSQFTFSQAISSTSLKFEWTTVLADEYYLVLTDYKTTVQIFNQSFTTTSGRVDGLTPSTTYTCYVYSSNKGGMGARSQAKIITTLVQPPTDVNLEPTSKSTARVTWAAVSNVLKYRVILSDSDDLNVAHVIRRTSATTMDITDLLPCTNYTVGVSSVNNFLVAGEPANIQHTTSTINKVSSISVTYDCTASTVTVTWGAVFGAKSYKAMVIDGTGAGLNCTSASTSCTIGSLKCGQRYQVRITAVSGNCESVSNTSTFFDTVPCAPANVAAFRECASNVVIFSWEATHNTLHYLAKSVSSSGEIVECRTTTTSCYFTDTHCGLSYNYTVYAISTECNSEVSPPTIVHSSPCRPTNVMTFSDCHSDNLTTTWDGASIAQSYLVEVHGNNGDQYTCTSDSNSCVVAGVPCGEHLSVWVTAIAGECANRVLGQVALTAPCSPTNVGVTVDCNPYSAFVNWTSSNGAVFYIATAQHANGMVHHCKSQSIQTNCIIEGLDCGQNYISTVIAANLECNSTFTEQVAFTTGPCAPSNVQAVANCKSNHVDISWQNHQLTLLTGSYTAVIQDHSSSQLSCTSNTLNNTCEILSVPCGKTYDVTVTYTDGLCSPASTPIKLNSARCAPENVSASLVCPNTAHVTWVGSPGATGYNMTAMAEDGHIHDCYTNSTSCHLPDMHCGQRYTITVTPYADSCAGDPSISLDSVAGPCPHTTVSVSTECGVSTVSWSPASGAETHIATAIATAPDGHNHNCNSSTANSCSFTDLHCGKIYSVSVVAVDRGCHTGPTSPVELKTVPCVPTNILVAPDCISNTAVVSWSASMGAVQYSVSGWSSKGNVTCQSSDLNCTLNTTCGSNYTVVVKAINGNCSSPPSETLTFNSVPCGPENVSASLACPTSAHVSWVGSPGATAYNVTAVGQDGHIRDCYTSSTSCEISNMHCGQSYTITVTPYAHSCAGKPSILHHFSAGPCPHSIVSVSTECGVSTVSWSPVSGAETYIATATVHDGHNHTCNSSTANSCSFTDLHCGENYSVSVVSVDRGCHSEPSLAVELKTVPCVPIIISAELDCISNTAVVSWAASQGAVQYSVSARSSKANSTCQSSDLNCTLNITCGSNYGVEVKAINGNCSSDPSQILMFNSAPCPPENVSASLMCPNIAHVSWVGSPGATGYNVTAVDQDGRIYDCNTNSTSYHMPHMHCGKNYTITVTPYAHSCAGKPSIPYHFIAGPCSPSNVHVSTECGVSTVSWSPVPGAETYIATATAPDGHEHTCNSSSAHSCSFTDLRCGENYSVSVAAVDRGCFSEPSSAVKLETVPCVPTDVQVYPDCINNTAVVSWSASKGAVQYSVSAWSSQGNAILRSSELNCTLTSFTCGTNYSVVVKAINGKCSSEPSEALIFSSVPCPPQDVRALVSCSSDSMEVSWNTSSDALYYTALATTDGSVFTCTSYDDTCVIEDLPCGKIFSLQVMAHTEYCDSQLSLPVNVSSAPSQPQGISGFLDCLTNTATISWDSALLAETYTVMAVGEDDMTNCTTSTSTTCMVDDLACGVLYTFSVTASSGLCDGRPSTTIQLQTAPCQPVNLSVEYNCASQSAQLSWTPSTDAVEYFGCAQDDSGDMLCCDSFDTNCTIESLQCGVHYNFTVLASDGICNGSVSDTMRMGTAPCPPDNVEVWLMSQLLRRQVLRFSWTQVPCSDVQYLLTITGSLYGDNEMLFDLSSPWTASAAYEMPLPCGSSFVGSVGSRTCGGSSAQLRTISGTTAPCPPTGVTYSGNFSSATVSWNASVHAVTYKVYDDSVSPKSQLCSTGNLTCSITNVSSSHLVITAVNEGGESGGTRVIAG